MSAGNFVRSRYQTSSENGGGIHPIRVQPETLALVIGGVTNSATTDAIDRQTTARSRKGSNAYGVGARCVVLEFTGASPDGYSGDPVAVPVMTPAAFTAYTVGSTGTYLGEAVEVISRIAESVR